MSEVDSAMYLPSPSGGGPLEHRLPAYFDCIVGNTATGPCEVAILENLTVVLELSYKQGPRTPSFCTLYCLTLWASSPTETAPRAPSGEDEVTTVAGRQTYHVKFYQTPTHVSTNLFFMIPYARELTRSAWISQEAANTSPNYRSL